MKIATWNVNSIRSRLEHVTAWLQTNSVDVLCLQETKVIDQDFPRSPFEALGYHLYISGQKSYNGVALASRYPLTAVSTGFAPIIGQEVANFDQEKRVISGSLNNIRIINIYVPNGSAVGSDKYNYKLQWLKILREYLKKTLDKNQNLCVCGDFNVAIEDRDIHEPKKYKNQVMASEPERQALREILELGLGDVFRKFTTEGGYFSWWDYRMGAFQRNWGWRIDYIYLTSSLYERATSCIIDKSPRKLEKPSDHAPIIVEL